MAGRFELMIIITGLLTVAFMLACVSTGTDNWIGVKQTGKDPLIISLNVEQGLFDKCVVKKMRSRMKSSNCYSLYDGYDGYKMQGKLKVQRLVHTRTELLQKLSVQKCQKFKSLLDF